MLEYAVVLSCLHSKRDIERDGYCRTRMLECGQSYRTLYGNCGMEQDVMDRVILVWIQGQFEVSVMADIYFSVLICSLNGWHCDHAFKSGPLVVI